MSLTVFGTGHARIYLGSLYDAMEVGKAQVDAGGTHEALIGLGYMLGPVLGISILMLVSPDDPAGFETWLGGVVLGLSLLAAAIAVRHTLTNN